MTRCVLRWHLTLGVVACLARAASAQVVDSTLWCLEPGDRVLAIARDGSTIYIGGNFSSVGPASGGGVLLDAYSGTLSPRFSKIAGRVNAVASDGRGGWFVGGLFAAVGGSPRNNLAHLLGDRT